MTSGMEHNFGGDFFSPASGPLSLDDLLSEVADYVKEDPACNYNLIIGTDSFLNSSTLFVTAVIIHRIGRGGRYFYIKKRRKKITNLRQRMFYEATMSIELASIVKARLDDNGLEAMPLEIHLDVGENGDTRDIVKEVVGMVTGSGYPAVTKPDSYGASKVADRHSK
ncbi:MAG: ribonuclease H-like YkuK family protein [Thermodesulfobacteriota bacterium]|nr:MAG: ribonuclease H-like YkuK family protein [Thermodesulfobacteriota bacterium]